MDIGIAIIILSLTVVAIVIWQFNKVLGRRTGNEKPMMYFFDKSISNPASLKQNKDKLKLSDKSVIASPIINAENVLKDIDELFPIDSDINNKLRKIYDLNKTFSPKAFLNQIVYDYEEILQAYAKAQLDKVSSLLTPKVEKLFKEHIEQNKQQHIETEFKFVSNDRAKIIDINLDNKLAYITLNLVSEVVLAIKDKEGNLLKGNDKDLSIIDENWSFAGDLGQNPIKWKLCATCHNDTSDNSLVDL